MDNTNKTVDARILVYQTTDKIVETINNSGLPINILRLIIENVYNEVKKLDQEQYNIYKISQTNTQNK